MKILLLLAASAWADWSGYLKNVHQRQDTDVLNTTRARLTLDGKKSIFRAHADYDHELLQGNQLRAGPPSEPQPWLDMDQSISTSATHLWRHRLYRGWVGVETESFLLRGGRQRIAWGTGKLWNPVDVLNPYQPLSVEREERRGVDAAYARRAFGNLTQVEAAWAPRDVWAEHSLLGRAKTHFGEYDLSLLGGKVAASSSSWMAGGDFAGNFLDGTLHGEWSYTDLRTRTPYWKAGLGYDYTFKDSSLVVEYLHSGSGTLDWRRYDLRTLLAGREVTLARNYLGGSWSWDAHALLKLDLLLLTNLDDGSQFFNPSLQWNALENLYLTAGLQRFGGPRRTEYGRVPNIVHAQAQFYF